MTSANARKAPGIELVGTNAEEANTLLARPGVQSGGRLVEQHDRRSSDQSGGEVEPTAHPAGVRRDAPVGGLDKLEPFEHLSRAPAGLVPRQPVKLRDHVDVLPPGELLVDRGELTRQPDPSPDGKRLAHDVVAEHRRPAAARREQRTSIASLTVRHSRYQLGGALGRAADGDVPEPRPRPYFNELIG